MSYLRYLRGLIVLTGRDIYDVSNNILKAIIHNILNVIAVAFNLSHSERNFHNLLKISLVCPI